MIHAALVCLCLVPSSFPDPGAQHGHIVPGHAVLLDHGKTVSQGLISDVMTPENLEQVYGMDVYAWMREMLSQWQ